MSQDAPSRSAVAVTLPNVSSPLVLPSGWTVAEDRNALVLIGPELDLRVVFLISETQYVTDEQIDSAWRLIEPAFALTIAQKSEIPSTTGWDRIRQIVYRTAAVDSKVEMAFVRTWRGQSYVNLITGNKAGFSRRSAQISELIEAWKPDGLTEVSLAERTATAWGPAQTVVLEQFIRDSMSTLQVPGLSIAIVQGGKIVYVQGFGVRASGGNQAITPETPFMIGSTTKALTTLMMARLVDLGYFEWSTRVQDILPNFALADPHVTSKLEVRHTVCACTGMPRRDTELLFKFKDITAEQRIAEMKEMRPTTGFGEVFQYSNYLVAAGGYAAAHTFAPELSLSNAYETCLQQLVLEPLGLKASTLREQHATSCKPAMPHAIDLDGHVTSSDPNIERSLYAVAPAGALWSTALDLAQYILLELDGGRINGAADLISTDALEARRTGGIKINGRSRYGLGLLCHDEQGLKLIGHGGNTLGFTSDLNFIPSKNIGFVVLTNLRYANAFLAALQHKLLELFFEAEPLAEKMVSSAVKSREATLRNLRERVRDDVESVGWMEEWLGHCRCEQLGDAQITKQTDRFYIEFESWGSYLGTEHQPDDRRLIVLISSPWSGALKFQLAAEGRELLMDSGQVRYSFRKVEMPS